MNSSRSSAATTHVRRGVRRAFDPADVLIALRRIVRYLRLADREAELRCGVSAAQLFVLHRLADGPSPSLAHLAEWTLTDQSSVSTVVARLVERGLVARSASRHDRRRAELKLTAAGRRVIANAPATPQAQLIATLRTMPAAQGMDLVRALDRLADGMGADAVAARMLFEDEPDAASPARRRDRRRSRNRSAAT